jgi:S-DNA-T family DNA segregation ATPase FtsK/SpoIIIE
MAKKRKQIRKKKKDEEVERSPFWPLTGGVVLCVLALFLLLGGFGTGGALPVNMFGAGYWAFGWAAYLLPLAFAYWGVHKFIGEDNRIPRGKFFSMIALLIFISAWLFTGFAENQGAIWTGGHGGYVGEVLGGAVLLALDSFPASVTFIIFAVLSAFFAFGISPKVILALGGLFKRRPVDSELGEFKARAEGSGFQLNEGVPTVRHSGKPFAGLRNSAEKLAPAENHEALTLASDPNWKFPGLELLDQKQDKADAGNVQANAEIIKDTFGNFNIDVEMEGANVGPRVTQYTLKPPANVKLTKITALENNLALDLAAHSIRMEAPIPGKRAVGIEVPNVKSATVRLSSIFQASDWKNISSTLGFAIGKDISGKPVVAALDKMPHLLVAGQTGSGKSVMINTILTSLLYRNSPSDLKLILVDPKQVELKPYDGIPHLLTPVITEPEKCISALKWAVAEMERRYKALAEAKKRNIVEYNNVKQGEGMPYIVIVIDELADLMMMAARDVEALVVRIAQKARAVGIHLVLATQRPSVDVITGLIKANVPARIAFTTASQVDSRTIIDQIGAEKLLGQGDMLLLTADMPKPKRVQGAFISDDETGKVTEFLRTQRPPDYDEEVISQPVQINGKGGVVADASGGSSDDDMFKDAVRCVIEGRKASTSLLQRRLRIGYGRAARLIEEMEERGIVGPADGSRPREVLVSSLDEVFGSAPAEVEPAAQPTEQV